MFDDVVKRYSFIVLLGALALQFTFTEGGIFGFIKMKSTIRSVRTSIQKIEKQNAKLTHELNKLQKDDRYLEEVARKKYGFIREGERVYRVER